MRQIFAGALGHAAKHPDDEVGPLFLAVAHDAEPREHLLLALLTHGARVVEDDVGVVSASNEGVAERRELVAHELTIEHVHLTAEGLEEDPLAGHARRSADGVVIVLEPVECCVGVGERVAAERQARPVGPPVVHVVTGLCGGKGRGHRTTLAARAAASRGETRNAALFDLSSSRGSTVWSQRP